MVRVRPSSSGTSPPGTRSRRQTEARKQQAKKRLSNGFSSSSSSSASTTPTTSNHNHVKKIKKSKSDQQRTLRTRSNAAKNVSDTSSSPTSARRKKRELQLHNNSIIINNHSLNHANSSSYSATGAELKRLHIAMRFKHEKINHSNSSPTKTSTPNHNNKTKTFAPPSSTTKNGNISAISDRNGLRKSNKNNISSPTSNKNENKLNYRQQVLKSYKKKRNSFTRLSNQKRRPPKSSEESDDEDDDDSADSENRDRKRRSALWVLNCEAEEFLFGETAADKHEVVLPPKSQPPVKRRRMRATELGELLKETALLESKLRKPPSSSNDGSPMVSPSSNSTHSKSEKSLSRKRISVKRRIFEDEEEDSMNQREEDEIPLELMIATSPYHTTASFASGSSCIGSPRLPQDRISHGVRLQTILETLEFKFTFENAPSNEIWYHTFSRQESPTKTFQPAESPVILPYERSSLSRRTLGRLSRLPRKSPRCHASTLAILSSLKPGRSSRLNSAASMTPLSVNCSYDTPISTRSLRLASNSGPSSLSPRPCSSSSLQPVSPLSPSTSTSRRGRKVSIQSPPVLHNNVSSCELKATEYFTDALAFLDDPYVVQLLAEEASPRPPITIKSVKKAPAPTTRSSQKSTRLDKKKGKRELRELRDTSPSKVGSSSQKTSSKSIQNNSHHSVKYNNNCVNSPEPQLLLRNSRSPPSSPKHNSSRGSSSRPSSPKHSSASSRGSSGPSSPQSRPTSPTFTKRKPTRNQPVVLVSDIYKHNNNNLKSISSPAKHGALNCFGEEVLFPSAEWLPPLPLLLDS